MNSRALIRRWHSPALFALIGLCFLLPFGTVSCNGAETTFTGAQLATWSVPEGGPVEGRQLGDRVEDETSPQAAATLAIAALGLLIGVLGLPRGEGWCAAAGIVTTLLMLQGIDLFGADVTIHTGYSLTLLLFVWAAVLHCLRRLARRRQRSTRAQPPRTATAEGSSPVRKRDPYWASRL